MNTNTAVAAKSETAAPTPTQRAKLQVAPDKIKLDFAGHVRNFYVCHLPEGVVANDLQESSLWTRVQRGPHALRRHDQIYMKSFCQTWAAEAVVSESWTGGATLAGIRIIQTPQRVSALFRDEQFAVVHSGHGLHHVERLSDGHKMTRSVASSNIAEADLKRLYPQKLGA